MPNQKKLNKYVLIVTIVAAICAITGILLHLLTTITGASNSVYFIIACLLLVAAACNIIVAVIRTVYLRGTSFLEHAGSNWLLALLWLCSAALYFGYAGGL
jgi:magnesium-transporting ATPase (P-type)